MAMRDSNGTDASFIQVPNPDPSTNRVYYYTHAYLKIDRGCNVVDSDRKRVHKTTFGFWPGAGVAFAFSGPGTIENGDEHAGEGTPIRYSVDVDFSKALCECIRKSEKAPPTYTFPFFVCGSWADDMWSCAKYMVNKPEPIPFTWHFMF